MSSRDGLFPLGRLGAGSGTKLDILAAAYLTASDEAPPAKLPSLAHRTQWQRAVRWADKPALGACPWHHLVERAVEMVRPWADFGGVALDTQLNLVDGQLSHSRKALASVVNGLLFVIERTEAGGQVSLALWERERRVWIAIRGLPAAREDCHEELAPPLPPRLALARSAAEGCGGGARFCPARNSLLLHMPTNAVVKAQSADFVVPNALFL